MQDSSLNVTAKQKEPAGITPQKSVRREGLATQIPIKTIFLCSFKREVFGVLRVLLLFGRFFFLLRNFPL